MNYNLYLKGVCFLDGAQEKFYNPEVYKIFAVTESDEYYFIGVETLKLIEEDKL